MEGDNYDLEKNSNGELSDSMYDDSAILQSIRLRHSSVLAHISDWHFVESELRFVLYSGIVFWAIHFLSLAV